MSLLEKREFDERVLSAEWQLRSSWLQAASRRRQSTHRYGMEKMGHWIALKGGKRLHAAGDCEAILPAQFVIGSGRMHSRRTYNGKEK